MRRERGRMGRGRGRSGRGSGGRGIGGKERRLIFSIARSSP